MGWLKGSKWERGRPGLRVATLIGPERAEWSAVPFPKSLSSWLPGPLTDCNATQSLLVGMHLQYVGSRWVYTVVKEIEVRVVYELRRSKIQGGLIIT